MSDTTTDFFDNVGGGAGAPSAVLKNPGDFVQGEVVEMFKRDYVPFGKTEPEIKEDGTKRQQLVVILQTSLRDWQGVVKVPLVDPADVNKGYKPASEDDGKRAVYAPEKSNIQFAIAKAIQSAGQGSKFEVGGTLGVKIDKLTDTGKGNPLKEHAAVWANKQASDGFFGQTAPAQQAAPAAPQAPAAPPVQEQVAPPAAPPVQQAAPAADPWATSAPAPSAPAGDPWASAPAASAPPF